MNFEKIINNRRKSYHELKDKSVRKRERGTPDFILNPVVSEKVIKKNYKSVLFVTEVYDPFEGDLTYALLSEESMRASKIETVEVFNSILIRNRKLMITSSRWFNDNSKPEVVYYDPNDASDREAFGDEDFFVNAFEQKIALNFRGTTKHAVCLVTVSEYYPFGMDEDEISYLKRRRDELGIEFKLNPKKKNSVKFLKHLIKKKEEELK